MPFIIQGQATKREPPAEPFIEEPMPLGPSNTCPVEDCGMWSYQPDEPYCDHEYPGKCDACDAIVGNRYEDLVWMGEPGKDGGAGWLCERCRSFCEHCDAEGVITFCGVCGLCLEVLGSDGNGGTVTVWPPPARPSLLLVLPTASVDGKAHWLRTDEL